MASIRMTTIAALALPRPHYHRRPINLPRACIVLAPRPSHSTTRSQPPPQRTTTTAQTPLTGEKG
eukprot:9461941-Lingulodinium_polyedra.AAC.1